MAKWRLDKMSYVRAKVLNGYEEETWPTGMMGWAEVGTDKVYEVGTSKVYNEFFTDYWYHKWEATKPRVEFETREECMEWLEACAAYDASVLQDNVNSPAHYGQGQIEAIDYISDFLTPEEYQGYLRGNIAKYLHRFPYKNGVEDLRKASWYLDRLIKEQDVV